MIRTDDGDDDDLHLAFLNLLSLTFLYFLFSHPPKVCRLSTLTFSPSIINWSFLPQPSTTLVQTRWDDDHALSACCICGEREWEKIVQSRVLMMTKAGTDHLGDYRDHHHRSHERKSPLISIFQCLLLMCVMFWWYFVCDFREFSSQTWSLDHITHILSVSRSLSSDKRYWLITWRWDGKEERETISDPLEKYRKGRPFLTFEVWFSRPASFFLS